MRNLHGAIRCDSRQKKVIQHQTDGRDIFESFILEID